MAIIAHNPYLMLVKSSGWREMTIITEKINEPE
jgi:hypothetical protein